MPVMAADKFERFFGLAGDLDVDKADLKRFDDFISGKVRDLLVRAQASAHANGRDVVQPFDLPITKGLQECIREFRRHQEQTGELESILDQITALPALGLAYSDELKQYIPEVAGGLAFALARSFKIIDPKLKNPHGEQWERCYRLFGLLL